MTIDILYFEGCPNSDVTRERVREALDLEGVVAKIRMVEIHDAADAIERRFLGSPTVRLDGEDVEPSARLRADYGFMCRTYRASGDDMDGAPSRALISAAIRRRFDRESPL